MKVKKYFEINKEQIDELLRSGALLMADDKIIDTHYKVSDKEELILREVKDNDFQKGYKYFKLKIENSLGQKTKIKNEEEIKIRLKIGSDSIEDFILTRELVPFLEWEIARKELLKGNIGIRIDSGKEDNTCRLQIETEKDKINEAMLKIKKFAETYGLKELEEKEKLGEKKEITTPKIKMK